MKQKLSYKDGEPFIAKLEQAQLEGNVDFVAQNLSRLKDAKARGYTTCSRCRPSQ